MYCKCRLSSYLVCLVYGAPVHVMGSPIVSSWLNNPILANRGAAACLTLIPGDSLRRSDVINNSRVIIPIIQYMGMRPSVDALAQEVGLFFQLARPRNKPPVKSALAIFSLESRHEEWNMQLPGPHM